MIYLGDNEPTIYLGDVEPIIMLGDEQVYPTGPFIGLRITNSLSFSSTVLTGSLRIKSSEAWTLTTDANWLSFSETTGNPTNNTTVTVSATTQSETTTAYITATTANYTATCECTYVAVSWIWVTTSIDRSKPITKCRFYMGNIPSGTAALGATEGAFGEYPNVNTDGYFIGNLDQATVGYGRYHKFNMVYGGGKYTNSWAHNSTTEYNITSLTRVDTNVYEWDFGGTLYWNGVEAYTTSPIYLNGNLIQVYM